MSHVFKKTHRSSANARSNDTNRAKKSVKLIDKRVKEMKNGTKNKGRK